MSKQQKKFKKWKNNPPVEAGVDEVKSLIKAYFGKENLKEPGGSHMIVTHEKLKGLKDYGQKGEFGIPVKGGQKVKGFYIKDLIKAIDIIIEDIEESK